MFAKLRSVILLACIIATSVTSYAQDAKAPTAAESVAVLQDEKSSTFDKAKACQRLATNGNDNAVPALAGLLADEELNVYARSALEAIGSSAADKAMREAAGKLSGRPLAGVLLSLGNRRNAEAIPLLQPLLSSDDEEIAKAAAAALADLGTPDALRSLAAAIKPDSTNEPFSPWQAEALLECAERVVPTDPRAARIAYQILIVGPAPRHVQLAAKLGQFRLLQDDQAAWLVKQLRSDDRDDFNLGLAAVREATSQGITAALVKEFPSFTPERRALLLRALGDQKDPIPTAALLAEAKSDSPEVQLAAIDVLGNSKDPAAAAELVNLAIGDSEVAKIAAKHLIAMESDAIDLAIGERIDQPGPNQPLLIALVGDRRMSELKPQLIALLGSPEETTRCAVLTALAQISELDDLDVLLDRAFGDESLAETITARNAVRIAAMRMSDRDACATRLGDRLSGASAEQQGFLLTRLREMGGKNALDAVVIHAKSSDPALKDAATRELGAWPTADAATALLDLAKNDPESKYQIRALRGYLRIARQLQLPEEERLQFFHAAMETARRDEEKKLALEVLTRIPSSKTLELATAQLGNTALRNKAAESAIAIAGKLVTNDPAAVKAGMEKVISAGVPQAMVDQAKEIQGKAGN